MRPYRLFFALVLFVPNIALAQKTCRAECNEGLDRFRSKERTIMDDKSFSQLASSFCDDHKENKVSDSEVAVGAKYGALSGRAKKSFKSIEEISNEYCASDSSLKTSSSGFQKYLDSIDERAFPAYQICMSSCRDAGGLTISQGGDGDSERSLTVGFRSQSVKDTEAEVQAFGQEGVACIWRDKPDSETMVIPQGATRVLTCTKSDSTTRGSITVTRIDATSAVYTEPWGMRNDSKAEREDPVRVVTTNIDRIVVAESHGNSLLRLMEAKLSIPSRGVGSLSFQAAAMQLIRWRSEAEGQRVDLDLLDGNGAILYTIDSVAKAWVPVCGGYHEQVVEVPLRQGRDSISSIRVRFYGSVAVGERCQ
jgi:hypothetical protein